MRKALSIIVPGRNEEFMFHTVDDLLAHTGKDTEVIAVCDGYWPNPPLPQNPRLQVVHLGAPIGQRAATNVGAALSRAKYIMKMDAHCSVEDGFDVKLLQDMQPDMTMIPSMHRLHVFDWHCNACGEREYQGTKPAECKNCKGTDITKVIVWQPRFEHAATTNWLFDKTLHFQYWRGYSRKPKGDSPNPHWERFQSQAQTGVVETMSCIGACFLMERERFWELGGMDEAHGSWGQYGTELACKAWLSGGRMVTSLKTWFAHLFRTGNFGKNGESSWPYPINQRDIDKARDYSRDLWLGNKWPQAKRPLSWLIEHFKPIPGWHEAERSGDD